MRSIDNISEELFDKIRSRVANIKLGNSEGEVTTDPSQARFFEFNFKHRDLPVGAVTISINEEDKLQVYFPNSMVEDADSSTSDAWYGFLKELSKFSARNMLNYETHNVTKERLDKKDYQFLTQRQDEVMENRLHGTSQKSFLEQGKAKLIIKHSKTVDETKLGARSRNISAIYIENNEGERFKFANNYLPGARAMARHVSNEGHTRDERGLHIVEIMQEMQQLKQFVRSAKSNDYVTEEAQEVIEAATDRYYGLKDTLKSISSAKGYEDYFENWLPGVIEVEENDIEDLKTKLTRQVFDDRMVDSLPAVSRALSLKKEAKMDKDAETRSDDELDAVVASRAGDIISASNSPDNIEVFKNEADEAELKNYFNVMKNSDMDTKAKNRNLVINVIEYLANNVTDDALAVALGNINYDDEAQYKAAIKIVKKYLQGNVDRKDPAPKKDLYGKAKESVTFEAFEKNMNMISEGTWALPADIDTANEVIRIMQDPIPLGDGGEDATNTIAFAFGDDELFDDLGDAGDENPEGDARPIIKKWIEAANFDEPYQGMLDIIKSEMNQGQADPTTGTGAKGLEKSLNKLYGPKKEELDIENQGTVTEVSRITDPEELNVYDQEEIDNMEKDPAVLRDTVIGHAEHLLTRAADDFTDDDYIADEMGDDFANMHMYADDTTLQSYDMLRDVMGEDPGSVAEVAKQVMKALGVKTEATEDETQVEQVQEIEEVDEVAESIAKLKAMAGVGSKARSNHGIHEGEEGYQLTPRSIVARQMRKLQDIERS